MLKERKSLYVNKLSIQKETATIIYIYLNLMLYDINFDRKKRTILHCESGDVIKSHY